MQNPRRSKSGGGFSHERSNLNPINPPEPTRSSDAEVKCFLDTYAQGRIAEAAEFAKTLTERHPQDGFGWKAYGAMLQVLGQTAQAVAAMEHAAKLLPDDPEAHNNLGTGYKSLARLEDSEASYRRALALSPEFPEAWCNLGLTLATLGRHAEALASFERADALKPDWPKVASGKCFLFYEMGRFPEAEALATAALEAGRWDINTFGILASLRRMSAADRPWLEQAEAVLKQGLIPYHELGLRYLMGKFCDDIGEHDRAFAHYQIANRLKRALKGHWNRDYWAQRVEQIMTLFPARQANSKPPTNNSAPTPVLIVGMPRSGTSLIEQILSSHPQVFGAGELKYWGEQGERYLQNADGTQLDALGKAYLQHLHDLAPTARCITDKMPSNSMWLGMIHAALPQVRILHLKRNPVDTGLSIHFQNFLHGHNYSTDLEDIAAEYRLYHHLMTHWQQVLPAESILDVPYEAVVEDQAGWSRKIIEFIGLEWDERCLDFHQTERRVGTASNWQARQPIYKTSKERWRNYEQHVGPLLPLLELYKPAQERNTAVPPAPTFTRNEP